MRQYILKRILLMIPTLMGVSLLVFSLVRLLPGDAVMAMLEEVSYVTEEDIERMREQLGLNKPFVEQYVHWIGGMLTGDWGESLHTTEPVLPLLWDSFKVTAELVALATIFALMIAIPLGVIAAIRQDTVIDYVARLFAIGGISLPNFWLATMVMIFPAIWWGWSPPLGLIVFREDPLGNLGQFIIPAAILGTAMSANIMRMTRTMMLEVLRQDYIRTAWSKGLRERVVVMRHAVKNALIPVVSLIGLQLPILVGGSVIMESIFNLPGLGRLLLVALEDRDYPVVSGVNLFFATGVVGFNLLIDLLYSYLDPRVRYE